MVQSERENMALLTTPEAVALKNILVATDFSAASISALAYIIPIARESHSLVHILHVVRPSEIGLALTEEDGDLSQEVQVNAQKRLTQLEDLMGATPHKIWLRDGPVAHAIGDFARAEHIDLIAIGGSAESDFKKFVVGSAAEEIIRDATCPVLNVGPHAVRCREGVHLTEILYVTSLWEKSHDGLRYAIQLAIEQHSQVTLLHVVEQETWNRPDREWLSAFRHILRNLLPDSAAHLGKTPELRVETARNATARILEVADKISANLIVMDLQPKPALATHLHDKLYPIISWANCPVLVVQSQIEQRKFQ